MKVPYSHGEGSCLFACMKSLSGWAGGVPVQVRVRVQGSLFFLGGGVSVQVRVRAGLVMGCSVVVYLGPPQLPSKISQIPTIEGH